MTLVRMGIIVALTAACGTNEDRWARDSSVQFCKFQQNCYLASFNANYDDQGDCVDELEDDTEDAMDDFFDDCDFEKDEANKCLDAVNRAARTCDEDDIDDLYDDCEDVWDC